MRGSSTAVGPPGSLASLGSHLPLARSHPVSLLCCQAGPQLCGEDGPLAQGSRRPPAQIHLRARPCCPGASHGKTPRGMNSLLSQAPVHPPVRLGAAECSSWEHKAVAGWHGDAPVDEEGRSAACMRSTGSRAWEGWPAPAGRGCWPISPPPVAIPHWTRNPNTAT